MNLPQFLVAGVELAQVMELTLNLGWAFLAMWMLYAWLRMAPRNTSERRRQLIALGVAIVILWPVISVTDDLAIAVQNPAELDSRAYCVRRDHGSSPHSIIAAAAILPPPAFAGLSIAVMHTAAPGKLSAPFVELPALSAVQNRPPPAV